MNALSLLKAEMQSRGVGPSALASELRVSKSLVTMWLKRHRRPGLHTALSIEQWSGGAIPASAWARRPSPLQPPVPERDRSRNVVRRDRRSTPRNLSKNAG